MRAAGHRVKRREVLGLALAVGVTALMPRAARAVAVNDHLDVQRAVIAPLPSVALTSMHGQHRTLDRELDCAIPLILNFVFTTCSSSCSVQTAVLAQVQQLARDHRKPIKMVSITIDPDNDTPEQLRRFAGHFNVGAGWDFYTGRFDDLLQVQKHFDVYRGSKASHPPVLLMRRQTLAPWVRVEGFPAASELVALIDTLP